MLSAPPRVDVGFRHLLDALDAEIAELRQLASHHFHHDGLPRESRGIIQRTKDRGLLRDEIARLHRQWQDNAAMPSPAPPMAPRPANLEPDNPVLIRHMKGISAPDAARRLGASEEKVRGWLEAGTLKGYRPTGGHWKITPADLMAFAREHRELL